MFCSEIVDVSEFWNGFFDLFMLFVIVFFSCYSVFDIGVYGFGGFVRFFLLRGVMVVIGMFWLVDDKVVLELVLGFYSYLVVGILVVRLLVFLI